MEKRIKDLLDNADLIRNYYEESSYKDVFFAILIMEIGDIDLIQELIDYYYEGTRELYTRGHFENIMKVKDKYKDDLFDYLFYTSALQSALNNLEAHYGRREL